MEPPMRTRTLPLLFALCANTLSGFAQSNSLSQPSGERTETYCFGCPSGGDIGSKPHTTAELMRLAGERGPSRKEAIEETYPAKALELGRVWNSHEHDFFFAVRAPAKPELTIDGQVGPSMQSVPGTDLWYATMRIDRLAAVHSFRYKLNGKEFG